MLMVLWRISQPVLLIYLPMHLLSKCHGPHALSLSFHHCCHHHYITTVIAICFTVVIVTLFPISHWQTQSHTHFPLWQILASITKAAHYITLFTHLSNSLVIKAVTVFIPILLNRAITTVAYFLMMLWYICNIFGFWEYIKTFDFTTPISTYILQTSCFQSHVRDGFSLWAGVWQWFHSRG